MSDKEIDELFSNALSQTMNDTDSEGVFTAACLGLFHGKGLPKA